MIKTRKSDFLLRLCFSAVFVLGSFVGLLLVPVVSDHLAAWLSQFSDFLLSAVWNKYSINKCLCSLLMCLMYFDVST